MADPLKKYDITPSQLEIARRRQLEATLQAVTTVAGVTGINWRANAPGGPLVQQPLKVGLTGVEATPTASGRAALTLPKASLFSALLPAPVGYVPGEVYGLHPEFWRRDVGVPIGSKPLGFVSEPERLDVWRARDIAGRIGYRAVGLRPAISYDSDPAERAIPTGPIPVTPEELAFLERLPPGTSWAQDLIGRLNARYPELTTWEGGQLVTVGEANARFERALTSGSALAAPAATENVNPDRNPFTHPVAALQGRNPLTEGPATTQTFTADLAAAAQGPPGEPPAKLLVGRTDP